MYPSGSGAKLLFQNKIMQEWIPFTMSDSQKDINVYSGTHHRDLSVTGLGVLRDRSSLCCGIFMSLRCVLFCLVAIMKIYICCF